MLHAVDDLLVEVGYADMTMKNIAERAGVSRQTVYRWWSTKAEILFEATVEDALDELVVPPGNDAVAELTAYLEAVMEFLVHSTAGAGYRALVGEAQHDRAVADLIGSRDVLSESAECVIERVFAESKPEGESLDQAAARLVGPVLHWILSGNDPDRLDLRRLAEQFRR